MVPPNQKGCKQLQQYTASPSASVDHWCYLDQDILLVLPYHIFFHCCCSQLNGEGAVLCKLCYLIVVRLQWTKIELMCEVQQPEYMERAEFRDQQTVKVLELSWVKLLIFDWRLLISMIKYRRVQLQMKPN